MLLLTGCVLLRAVESGAWRVKKNRQSACAGQYRFAMPVAFGGQYRFAGCKNRGRLCVVGCWQEPRERPREISRVRFAHERTRISRHPVVDLYCHPGLRPSPTRSPQSGPWTRGKG